MKKFKLFYNPNSGNGQFKDQLDTFLERMQFYGYDVSMFRTCNVGDIQNYISRMDNSEVDAIGVSGGDGTINIVVNAMMHKGLENVPLAIFPSGTANDFASFLGLTTDVAQCCDVVGKGAVKSVDLGIANDRYFVNVCAGGLFSNVSLEIDQKLKDTFGKIAYYLKGMEQLTGFKPIPMRITSESMVYEGGVNLFLALNSSGTGGIANIVPEAAIDDGLLDFVAFINSQWSEVPNMLLSFIKGELELNENVIFFKDKLIKIENLDPEQRFSITDLDGEQGPEMPVVIKNLHKAINIFYKK